MLMVVVYILFRTRLTSWTITPNQLIYRRGVIAITTDYTELYRIYDYSEHQNVVERLLGIKNIHIHSTDKTQPHLTIFGVSDRIDVIGYLRENVEQHKRNSKIYEITNH